jgi:hypothetical protein
MECKKCDSLLADYKYSVKLFTDAIRRLPGLLGHDRELAHQKLGQFRLACRDADHALTAHRRQHHNSLAAKAGLLKLVTVGGFGASGFFFGRLCLQLLSGLLYQSVFTRLP